MFSPIDVRLKPSGYLRLVYIGSFVMSISSLYLMDVSLTIKLVLIVLFLLLFLLEFADKKRVVRIVWDVNQSRLTLFNKLGESVACHSLTRLQVLPGFLWMIARDGGGRCRSIFLLKDTVTSSDYRRLRVAFKFAKLSLRPNSIRN